MNLILYVEKSMYNMYIYVYLQVSAKPNDSTVINMAVQGSFISHTCYIVMIPYQITGLVYSYICENLNKKQLINI